MTGPALPWGRDAGAENAPEDTVQPNDSLDEETVPYLTIDATGLAVGDRIQVKWQVESDEAGPDMRWWGATVLGPSNQQDASHPGAPVYEIAYDAQDGFEQEQAHIIFTAEHELYQLDVQEELMWRRQGDAWEDEEPEAAADGETVLTVKELQELVDDGRTLEETEGEVLGAMEPSTRIAVAAGFRQFADGLMSFLQSKLENSAGNGLTVTEEHVREFTDKFKRQRTQ